MLNDAVPSLLVESAVAEVTEEDAQLILIETVAIGDERIYLSLRVRSRVGGKRLWVDAGPAGEVGVTVIDEGQAGC